MTCCNALSTTPAIYDAADVWGGNDIYPDGKVIPGAKYMVHEVETGYPDGTPCTMKVRIYFCPFCGATL